MQAKGGDNIHDEISRTASGKIYFFERFDEISISMQDVHQFVDKWVENELEALGIESKGRFQDTKTGTIRLNLMHNVENTKICQKNSAVTDSITSTAHYTLKFLIHNNKLKVVMDNMHVTHEGVAFDGTPFRQSERIEETYDDLKKFESQIYEKAEEMKIDKSLQLQRDIKRMEAQVKQIKSSDRNKPRNKKLLRRYTEKQLAYQKLSNPETLKIEIEKDLQEKVDYDQIFQYQKWKDVSSTISNSLIEWNNTEASN